MLDNLYTDLTLIINQTKFHFAILAKIIIVLWLIFFLNRILGNRLLYLGIAPRRLHGLLGIFFAPFLHANFNHLFFNSIPLLVLSDFVLMNGLRYFIVITIEITIISGLLIWCFGRHGLYVGASAIITGYWGLLVCNIMHQGTSVAILLGVISLYYFAGIFIGVFPKKGVAWEGHLFGLIAGGIVGYLT